MHSEPQRYIELEPDIEDGPGTEPIRAVKQPEPVVQKPPIAVAKPATNEPEKSPETISESSQKEFGKEFGNNSPNNSETIRSDNPEPPPIANIAPYKKKGKIGRQRKYEEPGNHGEIPVKKVVLYRHIKGRHWPGMSQDMREWYEFYYFSRPKRTEKAKDADDYARHVKSWERGQGWIAEYETSQGRDYDTGTLGNSGKIVAYRKRANG